MLVLFSLAVEGKWCLIKSWAVAAFWCLVKNFVTDFMLTIDVYHIHHYG